MALTIAGVTVVSMGACKKNIQVGKTNTTTRTTEEETSLETLRTNIAVTEATTIKIFDDYELELETENLTEQKSTETTSEDPSLEAVTEELTTNSCYTSRFTSQAELEKYLEQIYTESGKTSLQIIEEVYKEQEEGNYYAYNTDLSAAAAYKIITEKGYSLEDVQNELDYVLACRINPGEIIDVDEIALAKLITIFKDNFTIKDIFQICERLALELHLVSCPKLEEHSEQYGWVYCEELDKTKIFYKINEPVTQEELQTENSLIRTLF